MTQKEYIALVNEAKQRSYEYYVLSDPTISDAEFDALVDRIEQAEQEHPEWTLADSPTQCVGSDVEATTGKRLVRHRTRMLSCQKAQTQEAVEKWMTTTSKRLKGQHLTYALEWKMDGVSCSLVYQDGALISAASRGQKGVMGQDWLQHVGRIPSVPNRISMAGRVEVRGEIVCPKADTLGYKDCRTAAASLMNQAWPSDDCKRLAFIAWQMDADGGIGTESISMIKVRELGFMGEVRTCDGNDVIRMLQDYEQERDALEWPTDGVVIKIDDKAAAASLGCTEHHPKGNIAYKFSAQKTVTRVINIEVKVGETGRRTPVAYLESVTILGREVTSASLGSERIAAELGVTAGCMVEVGLSNDVAPKIYRVISTESPFIPHPFSNGLPATESHNFVAAEETTTDSADGTDIPVTDTCEITEHLATVPAVYPAESATTEDEATATQTEQNDAPISSVSAATSGETPAATAEPQATATASSPSGNTDLFAQMQMQIDQLRQENDRLCNMIQSTRESESEQAAVCSPRHEEDCSCVSQEQPRRAARRNRQPLDVSTLYGARPSRTAQAAAAHHRFYNSSETSLTAESKHGHEWLKAVGLAAARIVALVVIFKTGLLIPLGLIGLGASGFLK